MRMLHGRSVAMTYIAKMDVGYALKERAGRALFLVQPAQLHLSDCT